MKRFLLILLILVSVSSLRAQDDALSNKLVNAFLYVDDQTFNENKRVNDYIIDQFSKGNYSAVLNSANSYLQSIMRMIEQMYSKLSEQERADLTILVDGDLVFHYILSSAYITEDYSIAGDIYDYLLFVKQLLLRTTRQRKQALPADYVTWRDIQRRLGNGEAAIEFVRFNVFKGGNITSLHLYAAVVVTQTCTTPKLILMSTEKNLTYWKTDNQGDLYDVSKYGAPLSQLIWLDILTYLDKHGCTTIYFAPFGILNNIAIESLPYDRENPMSWHYNLTRLSSTRELINKHNLYPAKTAALYGNLSYRLSAEGNQLASTTRSAVSPLPWSKQEIDSISHILSDWKYSITTYSKKQGTEASFKALDGKSPSIIHTATHGFVNRKSTDDIMQRSGLILSYGARAWEGKPIEPGTEDGILTSAEITALDLSGTDIVVLSACNTALGEITSEGVWGLQRAFKLAGVRTVVMSLWQVDDEATAVFMQNFYEELMKERRTLAKAVAIDEQIAEHIFDYPHAALAAAQRRMRQHPKYSSPYYWAAFIAVD